jgi:hypothetical protein
MKARRMESRAGHQRKSFGAIICVPPSQRCLSHRWRWPSLVRSLRCYVLSSAAMSMGGRGTSSCASQGALRRSRPRRGGRRRRDRALGHARTTPATPRWCSPRSRSTSRPSARRARSTRRWPRRCASLVPSTCSTQAQRGEGHRLQSARIAQLPFRFQVTGNNYVIEAIRRIRGDCPRGGELLHRPGLRGGQGTHVFLLAVGGRRPDVGGGDGQHGRGRLLRRRPARSAPPRAAGDGL